MKIWQNIVVVPVISLKTVIKHLKLDVKAVSTAVAILKTIRNVHLRPVKKAAKIVMVADANLTTPDY
ncbi:Uncharacterised protein [Klebsiella oxytoca]|jgi:hypothetical protein|nr:hypothetical protein L374_03545 [Klebsiella oxytoca MGH 28]EUC89860.1 hypothetical protein HMPREF1569_5017 [Klebsiella oxytoca OK-1]KMW01689.1 hypothetical protein HMPREF9693_01034 [Klebsiella oxytoca 10-5249]CAF2206613.1 hypothetical protein AI2744V1_2410 [Klebsiella oxytoca]CAH5176861.1 hypothetical protein AI2744V1_2410 [Klebsiella oxytoca]